MGYWTEPIFSKPGGKGRGRGGRGRGTATGGPGSWSWWAAPVGSGRGGRTGTRGRPHSGGSGGRQAPAEGWWAWWTATPGKPAQGTAQPNRPGRCGFCGKGSGCKCKVQGTPVKRPRRKPGTGPYPFPPDFRTPNGITWCGNCRSRMNPHTGHCTNARCPR